MTADRLPIPDDRDQQAWPVTWEGHRLSQLLRWAATTPLTRLEWLEEVLTIACGRGALPASPKRHE